MKLCGRDLKVALDLRQYGMDLKEFGKGFERLYEESELMWMGFLWVVGGILEVVKGI